MREIVFDTETTGTSHEAGDRIVEIGCVEIVNRCITGNEFHAYFHPERDMPPGAEAVHGLSIRFLSDKPRFREKVEELIAFIGDAPLVAHNAPFDFGFLNAELDLCGGTRVCMSRMVDTLALAKQRHPGAKLSLDALCTRYGIDRSHRVKHGALLDAQLTAQLYIELIGGRQIGLMLAEDIAVEAPADDAPILLGTGRPVRPPRVHAATAEELERHTAFIATLSDPLWQRLGTPAPPAG